MVITETTFMKDIEPDIIESKKNALVILSGDWCGPCKIAHKIIEDLHDPSKFPIYELDIDDCDKIPVMYNIKNVPSMLIYRNGEMVEIKRDEFNKSSITELMKSMEV